MAEGIEVRHQKACRKHGNPKARCTCAPSYRAIAQYHGKRDAKTFRRESEAKAWRRDRIAFWKAHDGNGSDLPIDDAMTQLLSDIEDGSVRNRNGDKYKPSVVRTYRTSYDNHLKERVGRIVVADLRRATVQGWVKEMLREGLAPETIRNSLVPLRVLYREAIQSDSVVTSPLDRLALPAIRGGRVRAVTPQQARDLLDVLPMPDRALWATAMYAALRRGELRALKPSEVDLVSRVIRVRNGFDNVEGVIAAKHRQDDDEDRLVPIVGPLYAILVEYSAWRLLNPVSSGFYFPGPRSGPFAPTTVARAADVVWGRRKLERMTLHEARHCCASLLGAAGVPAHIVALILGHHDVRVTQRYTHALPTWVSDVIEQVDAFLVPDTDTGARSHPASHDGGNASD